MFSCCNHLTRQATPAIITAEIGAEVVAQVTETEIGATTTLETLTIKVSAEAQCEEAVEITTPECNLMETLEVAGVNVHKFRLIELV